MRVWAMSESAVYHLRRDCAAISKANLYFSPRELDEEEAKRLRNGRNGGYGRRPCGRCRKEMK